MPVIPEVLLWLVAWVFEIFSGYALVATAMPGIALLAHGLAALFAGLAALLMLPPRYAADKPHALFFLCSIALFLPVVGMLCLLTAVIPALHLQRPPRSRDWQAHERVGLPFKPVEVSTTAIYFRGGLVTVLRHFEHTALRLRALMASRRMSTRRSMPILAAGLDDPTDEIRLLAYSMFDDRQRAMDTRIQAARDVIAAATADSNPKQLAVQHEKAAALFMETAELALAEDNILHANLIAGLHHVQTAIHMQDTGERQYLKGRILLHLGRSEHAATALQAAEGRGIAADKTAPYLAECAFLERDIDGIREQLKRLDTQARTRPVLSELVAFWS